MRLTPLFSSVESLKTHGTAISTIADNLANSNTAGFKENRTEFGDLFADSVGNLYGSELNPGNGVLATNIRTLHNEQGTIEATGRDLDFSINGDGYFITSNGTDSFYTRAGNFSVDSTGAIVDATGDSLMGFTEASPTTLVGLTTAGVTGSAAASTTGSIIGNLNADSLITAVPAGAATFDDVNAAASFVTPIEVIDSLGSRHDVALTFFKTGTLQWTAAAYVDGAEVGGAAGTPVQVGSANLTFGPDGRLPEGAAAALNIQAAWGNGASASALAVDMSGLTQFSGSSALSGVTIDGNGLGAVTGFDLQADGGLFAVLDNGQNVQIGTVALASFRNEDGLDRVGDNRFQTTDLEGDITVGTPGAEGRGAVANGSLETSTVDAAAQFVDLIRFQRAYQAGSQVISTVSELLTTTIQIA